jgi:Pyruvate/2-oxoacid:ferredoxin oxidoreductase delta subunit
MLKRRIIEIDQEKCDGCEQCVDACHEGAIAMVDGKAKLVSDVYCDGLGDCIGECPQDAITIVEREAEAFDEAAVQQHLAQRDAKETDPAPAPAKPAAPFPMHRGGGGGCPGAMARMLRPQSEVAPAPRAGGAGQPSALRNWPVQLHLLPVQAPYFDKARVLLAADCVPFAYADFHQSMLAGRTLIIGCPKLDDTSAYEEKLAAIFRFNDIEAVEVAFMEVPCCHGLVRLVAKALERSGKAIPLEMVQVGIDGTIKHEQRRASA